MELELPIRAGSCGFVKLKQLPVGGNQKHRGAAHRTLVAARNDAFNGTAAGREQDFNWRRLRIPNIDAGSEDAGVALPHIGDEKIVGSLNEDLVVAFGCARDRSERMYSLLVNTLDPPLSGVGCLPSPGCPTSNR